MVADIQLLQGKIIDDPEKRTHHISKLIEELANELVSLQNNAAHSSAFAGDAVAVPAESAEAPARGTA